MRELVQAAYSKWIPVLGRRPRPMDDPYEEMLVEDSEYEGWMEFDGDDLRGIIILQPEADHLWVDNVSVHPSASGAGLGQALLDFAADRARELDLPETWLFTHELMAANREIYTHLGWTEFEPEDRLDAVLVYFRKPVPPAGA